MTKESAPEELVRAIRTALAGRKYLTPAAAERLASAIGGETDDAAPHESLSDREFQVLRMIAAGKTGQEVATGPGSSARWG